VNAKNDLDVKVMAAFAGGGSRTVPASRPASPAQLLTSISLDNELGTVGPTN
jgi:hypothetical protein